MLSMFSFSKKFGRDKRGFSILELMVVLAIFAIMTTILISDIPNFREKSSLELTASEVATYVRGAQVYGSSQKGGASDSYGILFSALPANNSTFYLLKNRIKTDPKEETYDLRGFQIGAILIKTTLLGYDCSPTSLEIVYKANPYTQMVGSNFEPDIYIGLPTNVQDLNYADIMIKSKKDSSYKACLRISNNGQISNVYCDSADSFNNSNSLCKSKLI